MFSEHLRAGPPWLSGQRGEGLALLLGSEWSLQPFMKVAVHTDVHHALASPQLKALCPQKLVKVVVAQLCPTLCNSVDGSPPGSSVLWILQARILECVAIPFSRGPSPPRAQTHIACIAGGFFIKGARLLYKTSIVMDSQVHKGACLVKRVVTLKEAPSLVSPSGLHQSRSSFWP